jgi:hypothetical protein
METVKYRIDGTDLASRTSAMTHRKEIEKLISSGEKVLIDLSHLKSMTRGYADELFSILVVKIGLNKFYEHIMIIADSNILGVISITIKIRQDEMNER